MSTSSAAPQSAPVSTPSSQIEPKPGELEVSYVIPCLNEAETLESCIRAARGCLERNGLAGEVVIADNGSTDGSQQIATRAGARVVSVTRRGYGAALMGGIEAARGRYVIMGDADMSYDFGEGMTFINKLREGYDLVMGNRFLGGIKPGAMPWKNRYIGNPILSFIGRLLFKCPARDFHCGLRAFSKDAYQQLGVRTTGMEFASEMVIKSTCRGQRITEVPIFLHPDGRSRPPHLRPWRDGWRHLRFMMVLSPRWTLFMPGLALLLLGLVGAGLVALRPYFVGGVAFDVNSLIAAGFAVLLGYMWITTAIAMRIHGVITEIGPPSHRLQSLFRVFTLERGLIAGGVLVTAGLAFIASLLAAWAKVDFGAMDASKAVRPMIIGSILIALGAQTVLMSFVYSMLGIRRS
ncbi:MAG: glycosyltransferase [Phycisphaerales bacterium]|nr:glycosyltransferase [Phycisphaerales bacterium]